MVGHASLAYAHSGRDIVRGRSYAMGTQLRGHFGNRMCMQIRNVMREGAGPRLTRICAHCYSTKIRKPLLSLRITYVRHYSDPGSALLLLLMPS